MANEPDSTAGGQTSQQPAGKTLAKAPAEQTQQTAPAPPELTLDANAWADRARLVFKASPHAVRGALYGQDGTAWTEDEVRAALDEFSTREGT